MAAGPLPIGRKRQKKQHVSYKKAISDAMIIRTSVKTPTTNVRKCLRAFLAATLFALSALMQATVAPHAGLPGTLQLCFSDHAPADGVDRSGSGSATRLGLHAHCRACLIATAPFIPEKPPVARAEPSPTTLAYFTAWSFEPGERRRPGETRSRAPPLLS